MTSAPLLSIIVPFHNSVGKCEQLLEVLATLQQEHDVELILVDDGSTDRTLARLREFGRTSLVKPHVIEREKGGPGAARNSGLERASGKWVWFVDSDDRIDLGCIAVARAADWTGIDVIAWDFDDPINKCPISPGSHIVRDGLAPESVGETIVAKWFAREFLIETRIRFPEFCANEPTPLEGFVLPLHVRSYFKSDFRAYIVCEDQLSVTRGPRGREPHYHDKLATCSLGMDYVHGLELPDAMRNELNRTFVRLFLWHTIRLTRLPGPAWIRAARIMRQFRDEARRFRLGSDPWSHYPGRWHSRLVAKAIWAISAGFPSQNRYFDRLHMRAWGRPIQWQRPSELPSFTRPLPDEAAKGSSQRAPVHP
jgi:hypothetical protein